ncbi:phosphomevalonate kinase [Sporosarcina sp. FA9]|uniref:phosphomevalonate kinase n=1 Tax=Sporosarcina sp. FA9 TaxID=3413030 RepID=UPI003F6582FF
MTGTKFHIKVPGKLMIAGEYAVLEPDGQAIVVAVDRYIQAEIESSEQNSISLPQLGIDYVTWEPLDPYGIQLSDTSLKILFVKNAIALFNDYLHSLSIPLRPWSLKITSELNDISGKKYGLGSSAAVTVAVITSMCYFYKSSLGEISKELIYKLSAISHFKTQGNGSCADIAASTYGGWVHYASFHSSWLLKEIKIETPTPEIVNKSWPNLMIHSITPPSDLTLCVGWTNSESSTAPMISKIRELQEIKPELYKKFLSDSKNAVENLIQSFWNKSSDNAITSLTQNREALKTLSDHAETEIETEKLGLLIQIANQYGSGKTSGAGGGDCGIAFVRGDTSISELKSEWERANILPLNVSVSNDGATGVRIN